MQASNSSCTENEKILVLYCLILFSASLWWVPMC